MVLPKAVARNLLIPQEMCDDGGSWAYITEPIQDEWSDWVSCTLGLKRGEHYATSHSFATASLSLGLGLAILSLVSQYLHFRCVSTPSFSLLWDTTCSGLGSILMITF